MTQAPLKGIRILDMTNVLAGPFCCHQLAHMGADVIKVETPGTGDLARQLGADPARNADLMGVSFLTHNTGTRSITLNLKSASGKRRCILASAVFLRATVNSSCISFATWGAIRRRWPSCSVR